MRKAQPKTFLSENFTLEEFTRSETAKKHKISNSPNEAQIQNIRKLLSSILQPMRTELGFPVKITSGFRSVELNTRIGGKPNSFHLRGLAVDFTASNRERMAKIETWLSSVSPDLIYWKFYQDRNFFHVHLKK